MRKVQLAILLTMLYILYPHSGLPLNNEVDIFGNYKFNVQEMNELITSLDNIDRKIVTQKRADRKVFHMFEIDYDKLQQFENKHHSDFDRIASFFSRIADNNSINNGYQDDALFSKAIMASTFVNYNIYQANREDHISTINAIIDKKSISITQWTKDNIQADIFKFIPQNEVEDENIIKAYFHNVLAFYSVTNSDYESALYHFNKTIELLPNSILAKQAEYQVNTLKDSKIANCCEPTEYIVNENLITTHTQQYIAIEVRLGQVVVIKDTNGVAAIEITKITENEAYYKWRYLDRQSRRENIGTGKVFEKYERRLSSDKQYEIIDKGSNLNINAGPISVKWSYGSMIKGWLYYDLKQIILENKQLDDMDLNMYL